MHHFKPMEVAAPETSNAVMAALLINDLRNPLSAAHPDTPLENPMQLFAATAFHGGAWRTGYKFGTIGPPSVIAYLFLTYIVGGWLALYSFGQCAGWSIASVQFIQYVLGSSSATSLWAAGGWWVSKFTYLQALEVAHSALGMVRSPALSTAMQIASRITLVQILDCHDVSASPETKMWPAMLCGAWSLTEVVRYAYYGLSQLKLKIYPVTWLRYSMFPILYPTGVAGELGCVYYAMPFLAVGKCGLFAESFGWIKFPGVLLLYAVSFPMLFLHVVAQRKKVLGGDAKPKDKKA